MLKYIRGESGILLIIENGNAVIKINGKIAATGGGQITARLLSGAHYIIEALYPMGQNILPASAKFCTEEPFESPNATLLKYSSEVYALKFMPKKSALYGFFQPVSQIKYRQGTLHTATLYCDGIYYIELENENSIYKRKIDDAAENLVLKAESIEGRNFAAVYGDKCGRKYCLFIGCDEDYNEKEYLADSVTVDNKIKLIINSCDMQKHFQEITLGFDGKTFIEKEKKVTVNLPVKKIPALIPYYFLEALLAEDYEGAVNLLDKESYEDVSPQQIKNFFDEFYGVMQNPYERQYANYAAVKSKITDCRYELKYYDFKIKDGFIDNILEIKI